ncbi:MAG: DUF4249 family protein [Salinivirgaceae bacterium]|nr:DUF4249 family protein [Salinivirgaceae bacterium]
MKYSILVLLFLALFISSCNDDFDINSDWEDITIVYGILDPSDTVHYIRINKAYIGTGDVYEMAQQSDSIQYQNILDVRLIEYQLISGGESLPFDANSWERTTRDTIHLDRTDEIEKLDSNYNGDPGTFARDNNYLYKTTELLKEKHKYKLEIHIPGKKEIVSSEAYMIYDLRVNKIQNPVMKFNMANEKTSQEIEWESAVYGKIFQPYLLFHYGEITAGDTTFNTVKIEYNEHVVNQVRIPDNYLGAKMSQAIGGIKFYESLKQQIPVKSKNIIRVFASIDVVFLAGGNEFYNYLNVSSTTISFGQEPPEFSNIINGVGLFDARYKYVVKGKQIIPESLDSLANGRFTKNLNFVMGSL